MNLSGTAMSANAFFSPEQTPLSMDWLGVGAVWLDIYEYFRYCLITGTCHAEFGVPPIGQRAPSQPLAAFLSHKYRPPPRVLKLSSIILIPLLPILIGRPRSPSYRPLSATPSLSLGPRPIPIKRRRR